MVDIETAIAPLEKREIRELRTERCKLYRAEPPSLSRDLILRAIGYRLQERAHGAWAVRPSGAGMLWPRKSRPKVPRISMRQPPRNPVPSWFVNGTGAPIP